MERIRRTYTLRSLNMLNQHNQLLTANETLETRIVAIIGISCDDGRVGSLPDNILCLWEEIMHQCLLARQLNIDMTLTQTTTTSISTIDLKTLDCGNSLVEVDELDITIKSLACNTL